MTVEPPEFDSNLSGHSAVLVDGLCHAVVSGITDAGNPSDFTECGFEIRDNWRWSREKEFGPRAEFSHRRMCNECWPEIVCDE